MCEMFERNLWSVMANSLVPSGSQWNFSCNVMYNSAIAYVLPGTVVWFDATPRHFDPFRLSLWTGMSLIHILEGNLQWKIQPPHTAGEGKGCKRHSVMGKMCKMGSAACNNYQRCTMLPRTWRPMLGVPKKTINFKWPILCSWFRASLICIKNCPMRCNTKQSIYYSASSLYILILCFRAS